MIRQTHGSRRLEVRLRHEGHFNRTFIIDKSLPLTVAWMNARCGGLSR